MMMVPSRSSKTAGCKKSSWSSTSLGVRFDSKDEISQAYWQVHRAASACIVRLRPRTNAPSALAERANHNRWITYEWQNYVATYAGEGDGLTELGAPVLESNDSLFADEGPYLPRDIDFA